MVQLPDATDSIQPTTSRRHIESPHLWTAAIAGSIGAHLLLLAFTVPLVAKVDSSQSSTANVPVELIDLDATGANSGNAAETPNTTAIATPNTTQSSPDSSSPPESTFPSNSTSVLPDTPTESPQDSRNTPQSTVDDGSQRTPSGSSSPQPNNSTTGDSPQGNPQENQGNPQENQGNQSNTAPSEQTTPTQPPGNSGTSQPSGGTVGEGSDLPGVSISQNPVPASFVASVTASSIPASENPRDLPDQNAAPLTQSQEFLSDPAQSACIITPEVTRYFGETVSMQVVIDDQGQVAETVVRTPLIESQEYTDLAQCLVKTWQFKPAMSGGQPIYSDNLIVSITISQ
ncbi:hypothetical protein H6G89_06945 [Oscillatoria sp. FACHB-1407]|uniref:energy transducer TonB n=1 Tax=Oscillatoria sp. FACHB-1407 TaxID=2692847 RepID=UPI0016861BF4|nr:hypothetical protein [Oscillatoria sp. FACHB-1407]MBD2460778.1 hypothetical protein [Oscillatoria sp. FACHB-1407]